MKTEIECVPCFVRQAAEAAALAVPDPARREGLLRRIVREIAEADWLGSPPAIAQRIQRIIRKELHCPDPYRELKKRMNRIAAEIVPNLRKSAAGRSDPREAAVRMAIVGNLLDAGAKTGIGPEDLPRHMRDIWAKPLFGDIATLFREAEVARRILYLTDNAGEVFFDRLLIEALPAGKVTVCVRGAPVINDATMEDAVEAGLTPIAPVFDNGSDAPGTILEDCSREFRERFEQSDFVIAKGQGNYETLSDVPKRVFFLFTVKCPLVAGHVGRPVGSLMVWSAGPHA